MVQKTKAPNAGECRRMLVRRTLKAEKISRERNSSRPQQNQKVGQEEGRRKKKGTKEGRKD